MNVQKTLKIHEKSGKKSKRERRKFLQKLQKITPYEWEKWGLSLPFIADGPPARPLNFQESWVVEKNLEKSREKTQDSSVHELIVVTDKEFGNQEIIQELRKK